MSRLDWTKQLTTDDDLIGFYTDGEIGGHKWNALITRNVGTKPKGKYLVPVDLGWTAKFVHLNGRVQLNHFRKIENAKRWVRWTAEPYNTDGMKGYDD